MEKEWTGERLETFIYTRDAIDHLHRYALVNHYIKDKIVLDIASGEGYGSNLISDTALSVIGVDIDEASINKAISKYRKNNLQFKVGRADLIPVDDNSIDVVVSFETIEHHDKHQEMFSEIKRVLKPDGILIISTPDKLYYSDQRNFKNEFHVKELYKNEFQDLVSSNFRNYQILNQNYVNGISLIQDDNESQASIVYSGNYTSLSESNLIPLYLISICSDGDFLKQKTSIFDGNAVEHHELSLTFRKSHSYKVGDFILKPLKYLKKLLK